MRKQLKITCVNDNKTYFFSAGTDLNTISKKIKLKLKYPPIGAKVNNELQELSYEIFNPKHIEFIDISEPIGLRMYKRSLTFVLIKAFNERFTKATLKISHSVSRGLYCEIEGLDGIIYADDVEKIKTRMQEIIDSDIPFIREEVYNEDAIEIYRKNNQEDKCKLFQNRKLMYTSVYYLDDTVDYFYGYLLPSTGYLNIFDLIKHHEGMLLCFPSQDNPKVLEEQKKEEKIFEIFKEHKKWAKILGVDNVGNLNELIDNKKIGEIVKISEALHEKRIAQIADQICGDRDKVKLVLISGPSSSGKTSFCKRLSIQLQVIGFKTMLISLDDYFVEREQTPQEVNGDFDFECLEAIDTELFNKCMIALMNGEEVELPKFDFAKGKKVFTGKKTQINNGTLFIVEGIHGLNPGLTKMINDDVKFKIYVSALTQISIDNHNRIPTTDNRLLRRMVRDYKYRGYSANDTIKRWPSVRRGEEKHIFTFQEESNAIFNSALLYEIAVLKRHALPIEKEIPPTSIIREFLGGSSFKY